MPSEIARASVYVTNMNFVPCTDKQENSNKHVHWLYKLTYKKCNRQTDDGEVISVLKITGKIQVCGQTAKQTQTHSNWGYKVNLLSIIIFITHLFTWCFSLKFDACNHPLSYICSVVF